MFTTNVTGSKYLFTSATNITDVNETVLNTTINNLIAASGGGDGVGFNVTNSAYLYNISHTLYYNETMLNTTIDARVPATSGDITGFNASGPGLYNTSRTIYANASYWQRRVTNCTDSDNYIYAVGDDGTPLCAADSEGSDTNYYPTWINITNTSSHNISINVLGYGIIWGAFTDIDTDTDTNCSVDGSCSSITYDSETAAWDKNAADDIDLADVAAVGYVTNTTDNDSVAWKNINDGLPTWNNGSGTSNITTANILAWFGNYSAILNDSSGECAAGYNCIGGIKQGNTTSEFTTAIGLYAPNGTAGAGITVTSNSFAQTDYSSVSNLTSTSGQCVTGLAYSGFGDVITHITGTVNNITTTDAINAVNTTSYYNQISVNCSQIYFGATKGSTEICDGLDAAGTGGFTYTDYFNQYLNTTHNVNFATVNTSDFNATTAKVSALANSADHFIGADSTGTLKNMNITDFAVNADHADGQNYLFTDFWTTGPAWGDFYGAAISSGTIGSQAPEVNHPNLINIRDSTTANGGYRIYTDTTGINLTAGTYGCIIFKPATATTQWTVRLGFHDATTVTAPVDGCFFQMVDNAAIAPICRNNSVQRTNATANIVPSTSTWYKGCINITGTVNGANNADFYVYNSTLGNTALIGRWNVSGAVPSTGNYLGFGAIATQNTTAAAQTLVILDAMWMYYNNTVIR